MSNHSGHTIIGTIGGTLLSVSATIQTGDVVKTIVLGTIGAVTSFVCSYLLKQGIAWARNKLR